MDVTASKLSFQEVVKVLINSSKDPSNSLLPELAKLGESIGENYTVDWSHQPKRQHMTTIIDRGNATTKVHWEHKLKPKRK